MKKFVIVLMVFVFAVTGMVFAAGPQPGNKGKICPGVLKGEIVEITGIVASIGHHQNMVVETLDQGRVKIHGIGPNWYWEINNIDKPTVGEDVIITAFAVPFEDGTHYVAVSIEVGGETLQLRDSETGCPLWRKTRHP